MINSTRIQTMIQGLEGVSPPGWKLETDSSSMVTLIYLTGPIKEGRHNEFMICISESSVTYWESERKDDDSYFIEREIENPLNLGWLPLQYKEWMIMNLDLLRKEL